MWKKTILSEENYYISEENLFEYIKIFAEMFLKTILYN